MSRQFKWEKIDNLSHQIPKPLIGFSLILVAWMSFRVLRPFIPGPAPEPAPEVQRQTPEQAQQPDPQIFENTDSEERVLDWREGRFAEGPFFNQLLELGVKPGKIHQIVRTLTPVYDFRRARPGHQWRLGFKQDEPKHFVLHISPVEIYDIFHLDAEPMLEKRSVETFSVPVVIRGEIEGSLFQSLQAQKNVSRLVAKLEKVFAWDLDFYIDPRKGDRYEILIEERYFRKDGEPVFHGYGSLLAARYHTRDRTVDAYRFEVHGEPGYYNANGQSVIREFLRSPLKLKNITSSFKPKRFHPILKKVRPHNGVDYRANRNTPVMAVANGQVLRAGVYGGAGIAIEIEHRNQMMTQYFHLNKIAKGVRRGSRVKQGQVIGYVGKTGLATSYHLHFGMKIRGRYVDPQNQRYQPGIPIPSDLTESFQRNVAEAIRYLEPGAKTRIDPKTNTVRHVKPKKI